MKSSFFFTLILFIAALPPVSPDDTARHLTAAELPLLAGAAGNYPLTFSEKVVSDLRTYRNGQYSGHLRREERGRLEVTRSSVEGTYYVLENVIRESGASVNRVEARIPVGLPSSAGIERWMAEDDPSPRFRPFPTLPQPLPEKGDVWKEYVTMVFNPGGEWEPAVFLAPVTYRYDGEGSLSGRRVHNVAGFIPLDMIDLSANPRESRVRKIDGKHNISIAFSAETHSPLFIRDQVDETFHMSSGDVIGYKGFINHWIGSGGPGGRHIVGLLEEELETGPVGGGNGTETGGDEDIEVVKTGEGTALRIKNLLFAPDRAVLLPGQEERIKEIAEILKRVGAGSVLVVGHTADVGKPKGEVELSIARAKTAVDILIKGGIDPDRLIYDGRGSSEPIADNSTEEGRRRNRRVEIILLD